ncbi:helix-turn-helix transcriptional regulator [Streptomyces sp. XM4193]|uniref:helix-turn-helix domain-containing protein n=1 Tax=Streptomyces sp. XM4193 TaxID=2929782 RepID=UPI001FF98EEA|nr:helix-turn-helix transcriptional regulator [Streptomyces sp. XM4193]MCK1798399.1 helix-turn-helix transcriptional regulator [Streptomyces sp. XM4193]
MEVNPIDENDGDTPRAILARRLRTARARANLTVRALAEEIDYPYGYLSRVENGRQLPSDALAEALDGRFGTDGLFGELLAMSRNHLIADYSRAVVEREPEAHRIQVFTSSIVPGLLQTKAHADALFLASVPGITREEVAERVVVRLHRQQIFARESPPYYWAVMDEVALRRQVGGRECMREQLRHLVQESRRPRTTLQVVPFEQGAHSMLGGSLTLHTLGNGETIAVIESFATGTPVEEPSRVLLLQQRYDMARSKALCETESLALIQRYLKEYEDEEEP